jgi:hypothetical protein
MSWFTRIFSAGASTLVERIGEVADRFITTDKERNDFKLQVEQLLQKRDAEIEQTIRAELSAKERILVAELKQGDAYTKRARPTVVYAGLAFIGINYVLIPLIARLALAFGMEGIDTSPLADLPAEFWAAWGGICATWVVGRSAEKRGSRNRMIETITGNPTTTQILD